MGRLVLLVELAGLIQEGEDTVQIGTKNRVRHLVELVHTVGYPHQLGLATPIAHLGHEPLLWRGKNEAVVLSLEHQQG